MRALQNVLTLTAVLVVAVPPPAWSQSPVARIAFIDVQRVLVRSAAGVAARDQLEREKAGMQQKMDAKRKELEILRDELEKKGPLMTAEARRDKQDAFERNRRDAARLADELQKELESAGPDQISFLVDARYVEAAKASRAGAFLAGPEVSGLPAPVLRVRAPQQALIELLTLFHPPAAVVAGVAPSAIVARDASVAPTATVGALAVIESGAVIGPHVRIGPLAFVGAGAEVGEASVVHARVAVCAGVRLG